MIAIPLPNIGSMAANAGRSESAPWRKGYAVETMTIGGVFMKSTVVKRSLVVAGHKTSVSLEDAFWNGLKEIVRERHMTLSESMLSGTAICHRPFGFSCSNSIAPNFPMERSGATELTR